uniref:EF-hand domain-containing protein n=2 Tax=Parascaris TaxID=6254 RepID=A0A915A030_PARUN
FTHKENEVLQINEHGSRNCHLCAMAVPSLAVIFNNVDADRSGRISADELQRALSNGTWTPFNPETCRLMIGMFDSDRDGAINFAEFSALWEYVNQWTQCFRSFDRDGSGNIDKDELSAALRQFGYRLSERFIDLLMIKFDRTHTHRVNFDDFIQLCVVLQTLTASFRDKDADRDGVITVGYEEFLTMVFICNI